MSDGAPSPKPSPRGERESDALAREVDAIAARELGFLLPLPPGGPGSAARRAAAGGAGCRARRRARGREGRGEGGPSLAELARRTLAALAGAGLLAHAVAPVDGGLPSCARFCTVRERLARAHGLADLMFAMQGLGSVPIALAGTPEQRSAYLPAIARGEKCAAFAVTEEGAGSDVAAIATTASRDAAAGGYRLRGRKTFITNAGVADVYVVFAKTDPAAGRKGMSAFVVDADRPGFRVERTFDVIAPHPIGTIAFEDVPLPESARRGAEGGGYDLALETLAFCRPSVGAAACGFATRALEEALAHARAREQFGKKLADLQAIQLYLAEMATDLEAARLLVRRAAEARDAGEAGAGRAAAMAKLAATELAQGIADKAVQIHGGAGVVVGSVVERLYREVRALRIYEGTSEIQKLVIARDLLKRGLE